LPRRETAARRPPRGKGEPDVRVSTGPVDFDRRVLRLVRETRLPSWYAKAAMQGTLSMLPRRQRINRVFQKHVTHSLDLTDEYLLSKWERARDHAESWLK